MPPAARPSARLRAPAGRQHRLGTRPELPTVTLRASSAAALGLLHTQLVVSLPVSLASLLHLRTARLLGHGGVSCSWSHRGLRRPTGCCGPGSRPHSSLSLLPRSLRGLLYRWPGLMSLLTLPAVSLQSLSPHSLGSHSSSRSLWPQGHAARPRYTHTRHHGHQETDGRPPARNRAGAAHAQSGAEHSGGGGGGGQGGARPRHGDLGGGGRPVTLVTDATHTEMLAGPATRGQEPASPSSHPLLLLASDATSLIYHCCARWPKHPFPCSAANCDTIQLWFSVLQFAALFCSVLQRGAVFCSAVWCAELWCSVA